MVQELTKMINVTEIESVLMLYLCQFHNKNLREYPSVKPPRKLGIS
jgi:hypothetical protein